MGASEVTHADIERYYNNEIDTMTQMIRTKQEELMTFRLQYRIIRKRKKIQYRLLHIMPQDELDILTKISGLEYRIGILEDRIKAAQGYKFAFFRREQAAIDHVESFKTMRQKIKDYTGEVEVL